MPIVIHCIVLGEGSVSFSVEKVIVLNSQLQLQTAVREEDQVGLTLRAFSIDSFIFHFWDRLSYKWRKDQNEENCSTGAFINYVTLWGHWHGR